MIICSPDNPGVGAIGVYHLPYIEATEGKRHAFNTGASGIVWTRNPNHYPDPRCPECKLKGRTDD